MLGWPPDPVRLARSGPPVPPIGENIISVILLYAVVINASSFSSSPTCVSLIDPSRFKSSNAPLISAARYWLATPTANALCS